MTKTSFSAFRACFTRHISDVIVGAWAFGYLYLLVAMTVSNSPSVIVSWDNNREPDFGGFKIYYGKTSGQYEVNLYVGNLTSYRIENLDADQRYYFAVSAIDFSGNESNLSKEVDIFIPAGNDDGNNTDDDSSNKANKGTGVLARLAYNFPNPFNINKELTTIRYELQESIEVTIDILDANSALVKRLIKNEFRSAGEHMEDVWDGRNRHGNYVANGVYFCSIRAGNEQRVIKIAVGR